MDSYANKTVVITGGGTGIGYALAKAFAKDRANIVIGGHISEQVDNAVNALRDLGHEAIGMQCDVTNRDDLEALADFAEDQYGQADVLINNAGIAAFPKPLLETSLEDIKGILDVNLLGMLNGSQVFAKRFLMQDRPSAIYNLGSENSLFSAVPMSYAYIMSKHAVLALTELMAEEFAGKIEVKLICPGLVLSQMTKGLRGAMETDEFAEIAYRQLKATENFYVVSHSYNMKRIEDRYDAIRRAYAAYAPRYEGDDAMDVRRILRGRNSKSERM